MSMQNVNREIEKMMKNAIVALASKYNFDAEEAVRMICECEGLTKSRSSKKVSEKVKIVKSAFPLPYNGELNGECCFGIRQNSGLYTQCPSIRPESAAYCGSCDKQAAKNGHGLPDYGNIQTRLSKYNNDEEFVDPSGKKPVAYTKIMKKFKVTEEQVREEAAKHNMTLDPRHFEEKVVKKSGRPAKVVTEQEPKEVKSKGRPKKSKRVLELAGEEEDLFASLVMSSVANKTVEENTTEEIVVSESEVDDNSSLGDVDVVIEAKPSKAKTEKKPKVSAEEKKLALQKAKEEKKLALEKEKEEKKLALQKEKEEKKLALEKEKEAKKFLKELEKQEKQAIAEIKKENKEKKETKKETKKESKVESEEEADVVKKIEFEGKKYLKSKKTGIIYNMEQDVIGKWNESKNRIDFNETGEESEEEYDDDN
jgi:hypothetical protein